MWILDATVGRAGKQIQFAGNGIKIVGSIANPTSFQFMRLNLVRNTQLFIPLQNGSSANITTYKTVHTVRSNPNTLVASIVYKDITLSINTIPCPPPTITGPLYYLFTTQSIPVESRLTACNLQCIGKRPIGKLYQYVFYKY